MSPLCTGDVEQAGVWVCPFCCPRKTPKECYHVAQTPNGPVKVQCKAPCTLAPFHAKNPGELWEHFREAHGWDGGLENQPPRLLDNAEAPAQNKVSLPVQRGPSKAARAKARAKRKKKKRKR